MLTDLQLSVREVTRSYVEREISPYIQQWESEGEVPEKVWRGLGEQGFFGLAVDPQFGGAGAGVTAWALMIEELAQGDCAIANQVGGTNFPFGSKLSELGTPWQQEEFLKPAVAGEYYVSLLLSEAHAGSDLSQIRTRATKRDGGWVINGEKVWITGGATSGAGILLATTDPDAGVRGLTLFLVRPDMPGYNVIRREPKMGHRVVDICQISLDDLELTDDHVLGEVGTGYRNILDGLDTSRIGVAAQSVGVAQRAFDLALDYAKERTTFGQPIFQHQAIGFKLAEMATSIEVARQMYLRAAALKESGVRSVRETAMAKLFASEMAESVCSDAVQIFGGAGFAGGGMVEKLYRDQRILQIYEGTSEVLKMLIHRELA